MYLCIMINETDILNVLNTLYTTEDPDSGDVIIGNGDEVIDRLVELTSIDGNTISNILEDNTYIVEDEDEGSHSVEGLMNVVSVIVKLIK